MDLFQKSAELKRLQEKEIELQQEIETELLEKFVNLLYEVKEVEADYNSDYYSPSDRTIKVYYPILNTPEGFEKENEIFYRQYSNCINHEYTLKDSKKRKVTILEHAIIKSSIYESEKAYMRLKFNVPSVNIKIKITISDKVYRLERTINHKQLIKQIIGENDIVAYRGYWAKDVYNENEKKYDKFLKDLGETEEVPKLKELAKANSTKIQITDSISAIVEARVIETKSNIWLENNMYSVRLENMPTYSVTIKIKPYLNKFIELAEQRFDYEELKNVDELRKGKTLDEIIELLESFQ